MPVLLVSLPVWGATGLGWAAVAVGAGLWAMARKPTRRIGVAAVVLPLALTLIFGWLAPRESIEGEVVGVAVIQPGTSLEEKWNPANWREMEQQVWRLTAQASSDGAEVILWPESSMPYRLESNAEYRRVLAEAAQRFAADIVLNSVGGSESGRYTNSAYVVRSSGEVGERYDKVRLVPFGEFVPWWAQVGFTRSLVREVGSFTAGEEPRVLRAKVPLGMAICYEVIFADLIAYEVRSGAELLTTVTNDGWYGYSWAPRQHFAQVILRAVETRRWFARAALTGVSGFVSPSGHVRASLDVGETGVLVEELRPATGITPRVRLGDWWLAVISVAAIGMLVGSRRRRSEGSRAVGQ
jgi:apolipoprotein N-acyltransferase